MILIFRALQKGLQVGLDLKAQLIQDIRAVNSLALFNKYSFFNLRILYSRGILVIGLRIACKDFFPERMIFQL